MEEYFDLVIIGGGINGCGIAADAAMRGLKTLLIEQDDLASKTSSSSSKMIHGGLRYLEQNHFSLVKKALNERQTLLEIAPHLVHSIALMLPYKKQLRPAWLLRVGLFIYDHLSVKNKLPHTHFLRRNTSKALFSPLNNSLQKGFLFYDAMTDDARLTISNALQATQYGAKLMTHAELITGKAVGKQWELHIKTRPHSGLNHQHFTIKATVVINTTGPWVVTVNQRLGIANHHHVSLVKGSHILLPKLYEGTHGYLLQNNDQRVVFVLPYHGLTMVGTTDIKLKTCPKTLKITPKEIQYLLKAVHSYFRQKIKPSAVVFSWSGIRPLIEDKAGKAQALSRDYAVHYSESPAPCVVVYGGKITTYRQLAKDAIDSLKPLFPDLADSSTHTTALPGSNTPKNIPYEVYSLQLLNNYPWLNPAIKSRLIANYGSRLEIILAHCNSPRDLGLHFGHGLYQCEVDYLIAHEWAKDAEDVLWRRTKLGLLFSKEETQGLDEYILSFLLSTNG